MSESVLSFLDARLRSPEFPGSEAEPVRDAPLSFCCDAGVQKMVSNLLGDTAGGAKRELFLLDTIDRCELKEFPASWTEHIGGLLEHSTPEVRLRSLNLIRALQIPGLDDHIAKIASSETSTAELRTTALAVLVPQRPGLNDAALKF